VKTKTVIVALLLIMTAVMLQPTRSFSQQVPDYLRDRGAGIPTSIFGTYVRKGELLIYPFYEYYRDKDLEYEPAEFGFGSTQEFRGRYRANEALLFIGYGISDRWALEFEAAGIAAKFNKAATDLTALPADIKESGLGDVEAQIRRRWNYESAKTPEFFNYFEAVFPTGEKIASEYQKRASNNFRFYAMLEGSEDELAIVPGMEWQLRHGVFLKVNNGFGLTSKAIDFAPEVGIMFSLSRQRD
jgi:hypothetical protein